jgi:hypothetical protein
MAENGRLPDSGLAPINRGRLRRDAAAAFNAMNVEARRLGVELYPTGSKSSYRSHDQQVELWNLYRSGRGNLAARPGNSNHGWGLAVDFATQPMRSIVDRIGKKYGWAKEWSDAPSEWWHIKWREGVWSGPDPGPGGEGVEQAAQATKPVEEEQVALAVATMPDGRFEVFVEDKNGNVWHTWQVKEGGWTGAEAGKRNAGWASLGTPGK